jgi:hypothetical protein
VQSALRRIAHNLTRLRSFRLNLCPFPATQGNIQASIHGIPEAFGHNIGPDCLSKGGIFVGPDADKHRRPRQTLTQTPYEKPQPRRHGIGIRAAHADDCHSCQVKLRKAATGGVVVSDDPRA